MIRSFLILSIWVTVTGCTLTPDSVSPAPDPQAKVIVFDIDGTLTPDVTAFTKVRPGAADAVKLYAEKGYQVVYLSARIRPLQSGIPGYLDKHGFPSAPIHVPESREDGKDHAAFKTRVLEEYLAQGWSLQFAYGDSTTDFEAYASVGIPEQHVFALRRRGEKECLPGTWNQCLTSWDEHLDFVEALPDLNKEKASIAQN